MERLQKVLAAAGIASRRKAEELILQGQVRVNGQVVTALGSKVDPQVDKITVAGKPVIRPEEKVYLLLHKPAGYVTTVSDPQGRHTVIGLLKDIQQRVYPVGRLDYETEGLLLLTNDGELAYRLTHPKHGVKKTYRAKVVGIPSQDKLERLRRGVELEDGMTAPAQVHLLNTTGDQALLELTIHEGRNRQVRRMCEAVGHPVLKLQRTAFGSLNLRGLAPGSFRRLKPAEISSLRRETGLAIT